MSFYGINHFTELNMLEVHEYNYPLFGYWVWLLSSIFMVIYHYKRNVLKSQTI